MKLTDKQARQMAETAFMVRQWAQPTGLNREQQIEQIAEGLKVDLRDFGIEVEDEG